MTKKIRSSLFALTVTLLTMALFLPACKTLTPTEKEPVELPGQRTGFLTAKVAAFRHAMENLPDEEKRYGSEFYTAAGVLDSDPSHVKVLVAALADMHPPVIGASKIYTRDENSKWLSGKPAMVWTSKLVNVTADSTVFIVVGWMHSNLLYQYYEYEVRYLAKDDAWEVVDYGPIERTVE